MSDEQPLDLTMITPPATEPVALTTAKLHCRVDGSDEDGLIEGLIAAARAHIEDATGRALVERTLEIRVDAWPVRLYLPNPPAMRIVSVTAVDGAGAATVLDSDAYTLRTGVEPGYVLFDSTLRPAVDLADFAGVRVRYAAGYGAASDVPTPLKQAILLLVGHWYAYREAVGQSNQAALPFAVDALLGPYRLYWFGAWAQ
jgi:uncharacterized phiE125 gp8 family phage protein